MAQRTTVVVVRGERRRKSSAHLCVRSQRLEHAAERLCPWGVESGHELRR